LAKDAEKQRRRELEAGFHNITDVRQQRIRSLKEIIDEYLVGYRLRNPLNSLCSICSLSCDLRLPKHRHGRVLNHKLSLRFKGASLEEAKIEDAPLLIVFD